MQACDGDMACMPLTGPLSGSGMGYCTQTQKAPGHDAAKEYYVAKRSTVSGTPCRLPIIAGCGLAPFPSFTSASNLRRACQGAQSHYQPCVSLAWSGSLFQALASMPPG